jgi:ribulose-phosphate 3-epimerase
MIAGVRTYASLMCSGFRNLEKEFAQLKEAGIDGVHFDVMDGRFVPNLALGPDLARAIRDMTDLEIEVHLMVERPEYYIHLFAGMGIDRIQVHVESTTSLLRTIRTCSDEFRFVDVVINPLTPLCYLEPALPLVSGVMVMTVEPGFAGQKVAPGAAQRIAKVRAICPERGAGGHPFSIEADGQVNSSTIGSFVRAGANSVVLGTSGLYRHKDGFRAALAELEAAMATVATPE